MHLIDKSEFNHYKGDLVLSIGALIIIDNKNGNLNQILEGPFII